MPHFAANLIFDGYNLIKNAYVSVDNKGIIQYVSGENEALTEKPDMFFYNGIICPGFVNTHSHLELSSRSKFDGKQKTMSGFIKNIRDSRHNQQDVNAIKLQDRLMFENGISVVGDISNSQDTLIIKKDSKIHYHTFVEIFGLDPQKANAIYENAREIRNRFAEAGLVANLTLHSLYSISKDLYRLVRDSEQSLISLHFLESLEELELFSGHQNNLFKLMRSIYSGYLPVVNNISQLTALIDAFENTKIISVHNVFAEDRFLNPDRVVYCICPKSNLYLHNSLPSHSFVNKIADEFVVGTDSLVSNDKLCILSELKILMEEYPFLNLSQLLKASTINGAKALNCDDRYGSFEIGKQPGIILIEDVDLSNRMLVGSSTIKRLI
ncbi:MAG: amidohydrolase family protein [Bacteroidales bacterium]|nr:amidohydrolase family protein [Bacteroidales bacterium]